MRRSARAAIAILFVAGAVALSAPAPGLAQAELSTEEAAYAGQVGALVHLYAATMQDLAGLSGEGAARWADLAWQNDVIGEAAVFDALREAADALVPPGRFAGSTAELQESFRAADRAGELVRQGIEAGDLDTFAQAAPALAEADDHLDAALTLLRDEGVTIAGAPAPATGPVGEDGADDARAYADAAAPIVADAESALVRYRDLAQAPVLTDEAWRIDVATQAALWDQAYQEALLLAPPPALEAAHGSLVEGLRLLAAAGVELQAAIDGQDVAGIAAAGRDIDDAAAQLDAAANLLDAVGPTAGA